MRRGLVQRHVKAAIQLAHATRALFRVHVVNQILGTRQLALGQVGNRQGQRGRLQRHPNRVGVGGIGGGDLRDHGALVGHEIQQRLGLELAQGLADGHAAHSEGGGQVFLAQGSAAGQATGEDGLTQGGLDEGGGRAVAAAGFGNQRSSSVRAGIQYPIAHWIQF
jgi:hypothetical protein